MPLSVSIDKRPNAYKKLILALSKKEAVRHNEGIMNFPVRLAALRKEIKMTQFELAEALKVSVDSVRRWENGTREPRLAQLKDLAALFGLSIDGLLGDGEPIPRPEVTPRPESIVFESGDMRLELPPTPETYAFLERRLEGLLSAGQLPEPLPAEDGSASA